MQPNLRKKFSVKIIPKRSLSVVNFKYEDLKHERQSNKEVTQKINVFENELIKKQEKKQNCFQKCFTKVKNYVHKVIESVLFHVIVLILSIFSLFNNDFMTLTLPVSVDHTFHLINEMIFIFFLTELIIFSIFKPNFLGSFFFYLDIIALISLIPEVSFIWIPITYALTGKEIDKNDPTMTNVVANLHLVKASRTSQLGSKASKYIKLLRLLNFLKIARLSKVIEESQKLKRENLNFLTNIFGRVAPNKKFLKKSDAFSNLAVKRLSNKKTKLRLNSKLFDKKNLNKRRSICKNVKIPNSDNDILSINKFNKGFENKETFNPDNSNKEKSANSSDEGSYKYQKIFTKNRYQGKSIKYDEGSKSSTINHDAKDSLSSRRNDDLKNQYSTKLKYLNQMNQNYNIAEDQENELEETKKISFETSKNKMNFFSKNSLIKINKDSNIDTINDVNEDSKTAFIKNNNEFSILNKKQSFKNVSKNFIEDKEEKEEINIEKNYMRKGKSQIGFENPLRFNINKTSIKTFSNKAILPLIKEKNSNKNTNIYTNKDKPIFQRSIFPTSKLSSSKFFFGKANLGSSTILNSFSKNNMKNTIKKTLIRHISGKSIFPFISSLNKNSFENNLQKLISNESAFNYRKLSKKLSKVSSSNIMSSKFGSPKKVMFNNTKINTFNKSRFNNKLQIRDPNNDKIQSLLINQFNQFEQEEIDIILNRANSDDENLRDFQNPLQIELEEFLKDLNMNITDLFEHKLEGLSDFYIYEDDTENLVSQIANDYLEAAQQFNLNEVLNEKSQIYEEEEDVYDNKNDNNNIFKIYSRSFNFSSMDSSKSDITYENEEKKSEDKNRSNNKIKSPIKKFTELAHFNSKENKVMDFFGDLQSEKSNVTAQDEKAKLNKKEHSNKIENKNIKIKRNNFFDDKKDIFYTTKVNNFSENLNDLITDQRSEIGFIKKNTNRIKKLNIKFEEINEAPFMNDTYQKIKNSKTKKITKTEFIQEEKIYEIKNLTNRDEKSRVSNSYSKKENIKYSKIDVKKFETPEYNFESKSSVKEYEKRKSSNNYKISHSSSGLNKNSSSKIKVDSQKLFNKNNNSNNEKIYQDKNSSIISPNKFWTQPKRETIINNSEHNLTNTQALIKPKFQNVKLNNQSHNESHEKRQTLDASLMEKLTQKVVILILILLIMLPVLNGDYIKTFILNDEDIAIENYCMNTISMLINLSESNSNYLYNLKRHIDCCERISVDITDHFDFNSTEPYFLYMNFSDYLPFMRLIKKYNKTDYSSYISRIDYDNFTKRPRLNFMREGYDFISDSFFDLSDPEIDYSKITYIMNNRIFFIIDNTLSILKSIFIGVVLVWGAFLVSNDLNKLLIFPLENIKKKMIYLIDHSDEVFIKKDKLFEKKESLLIKKKKKNNSAKRLSIEDSEMKIIDKSLGTLINLLNTSLGNNILKIFSNVEHNKSLKLNLNKESVKFRACYMFVKMSNLDNLMKKHQEQGIIILNKINYVIHSIAAINLAEINIQRNLLIWEENINEIYYEKIKYLLNLVEKSDSEIEQIIEKIREDYELPNFFEKDFIIKLAILTANKIIASLINNLFETFSLFLDSGATLNLILDYGEIHNGIIGSNFKLDEIFIGKNFSYFQNLSSALKYDLPSIIISNNIYEVLSQRLKDNFYISEIVLKKIKDNGSPIRDLIFRQYIDFSEKKYLEENINEKSKKKDANLFLKKHKISEETISFYKTLKENSGDFEEYFIKDTEVKLNTNFINNNIINAINGIFFDVLNKKFSESQIKIKHVLKNIKVYNEIFEYNISNVLKELELKLQKYIESKNNHEVFFTIDISGKN